MLECLAIQGIRPVRFYLFKEKGRCGRRRYCGYEPKIYSLQPCGMGHLPQGKEKRVHLACISFKSSTRPRVVAIRGISFLYRQRKRQPSLSLNIQDFSPRTYIYWVATAIGVVRPLAGLGSMSIKNALSDNSGVFHRPWYDTVL